MTVQKIFDALLVLQYRSGNKKALGLLVKRHHQKLCRHAYWYTHDMEVSKDIVQDCWGVIIIQMPLLKEPNSFGSWAMRIVTRKSLDFLNRTTINRKKLQTFRPDIDVIDEEEDKTAVLKSLQIAMSKISDNQKIVLRLFYTEAYSLKEISAILAISEGTVKSRLFHAREKLKSILKNKS